MSGGFVRRYGDFPGAETLGLIEGVVVVDAAPPGQVGGVGVGTACMVGEFPDVSSAVQVGSTGLVTTKVRPIEVFSGQDMLNKVGGFDETIGDFGGSGGNGFTALRGKRFSRLVVAAINLASAAGVRLFRQLPTCASSDSAAPALPLQAATVVAGREFKSGSSRARLAARAGFTDKGAYAQALDGAATATSSGATKTFRAGLLVPIGDVDRTSDVVTVTAANKFQVGQSVYMAASETNFPAGWKTVTSTSGSAFTYAEVGADATSTATHTYSLVNLLTAREGGPVKRGDALVVGVIGGAGALGSNARTYRVAADASSVSDLTVEVQDGSSFDFATGTLMPFRIHYGSDADTTPGVAASGSDGTFLPARPIDATIAAATALAPTLVPPSGSATSWDPLSGLAMRTHPSTSLAYTAAVQAPNAAASPSLDALYSDALDALLSDSTPARDVNLVACARKSSTIRAKLKGHVAAAAGQGVGRTAVTAPEVSTASPSTVMGDIYPGVGAARDERLFFTWPGAQAFIPEAVGYSTKGADGNTYTSGMVDEPADSWLLSVLSNLAPERNPGQTSAPVPEVMASVLDFQRGTSAMGMAEYIRFRQLGVVALRLDKESGPIFQSGVTTSLTPGRRNIARRRFADFVEDGLAVLYGKYTKEPMTRANRDAVAGETVAFLEGLKSTDNEAAQRVNDFEVDDKSGNTPDLLAAGIFVVISKVRMLATMDVIVCQAEVGESVRITTT